MGNEKQQQLEFTTGHLLLYKQKNHINKIGLVASKFILVESKRGKLNRNAMEESSLHPHHLRHIDANTSKTEQKLQSMKKIDISYDCA